MRKRSPCLQRTRCCYQSVRFGLDQECWTCAETIPRFDRHTSGHEFVGEVIVLGSNFFSVSGENAALSSRPVLYSTLKVGDKVVSPFTVSCGECRYVNFSPSRLKLIPNLPLNRPCRQGFTSRCTHSLLFGSPALEGGQAQYVRVPYAGGTLFRLDDVKPDPVTGSRLAALADSSLLLLADILPTGYFAALQLLQHPKLQPLLSGNSYPRSTLASGPTGESTAASSDVFSIALIGLGPVGIVRTTSLSNLDEILRDLITFRSAPPSVSWTSSGRTGSRTIGLSPSTRTNRGENASRRSTPDSSKLNLRSTPNRPSTPSTLRPQRRKSSLLVVSVSMAS